MDQDAVLGKRGRGAQSFHPHKRRPTSNTRPHNDSVPQFGTPESALQAALQDFPFPACHTDHVSQLACCLENDGHAQPQPPCDGHCPDAPTVISCSDQSCPEEQCPDLGPCHSIDCLTPCFDSDCHVDPCPDGDACGSPCYSAGCQLPECDDACPEEEMAGFHCTDDGQFCMPQSSWDMSCRCVDPACLQLRGLVPHDPFDDPFDDRCDCEHSLETSFPHCHEPTHCHHDFVNMMAPPAVPGPQQHHDPYAPWHDMLSHSHSLHHHNFDYALEIPATPALTHSSSTSALTGSSHLHAFATPEADPVCQWTGDAANHVCGMRFESAEELHQHVVDSHIKSLKREDRDGNGFLCHWKGCDRYLCRSFTARPKLCRHGMSPVVCLVLCTVSS